VEQVVIHPEVLQALREQRPVVALESAVITCGLPREPLQLPDSLRSLVPQWNNHQPVNLEIARAMTAVLRKAGAVPAQIALIDGLLRIGLEENQCVRLAHDPQAGKVAAGDLASCMTARMTAGTTVSATLRACILAQKLADAAQPIRVFATGGIGGVHQDWARHPDVSADLHALAHSPVAVVSAGAKSILDLPATLEALQMLSVPVIGFQTQWFPQFYSTGVPGPAPKRASIRDALPLQHTVQSPRAAAELCQVHWNGVGMSSAVLVCNPVPEAFALDQLEVDLAVAEAERLARHAHVSGPQRTPFVLGEVARLTEGRSLLANIALLLNNASLAGEMAREINS
jgi:pseudouridine-5'-phosphate glycosidase